MEKFKKILNTIVGALLILPNLLAAIGVIDTQFVSGMVENIGIIGTSITAIVTAVGSIILVFTDGEPSSVKNVV